MVAPRVLLAVCCVCAAAGTSNAGTERMFTKYTDHAPDASLVPLDVISGTSGQLGCHGTCVRRTDCLAFWLSGGSCNLFDTYVDDPASQLHTQTGDVFFNLAPNDKVSVTTENSNVANIGFANVFPEIQVKKAGRVLRWEVRCKEAGVVYLAVWRGDTTSSITLISKHRVTIPNNMLDQIVTYDVPASETVTVEVGDFVGFHYDDTEPMTAVRLVPATSDSYLAIRNSFFIQDSELPVGKTLIASQLNTPSFAFPSLALYVG